MRRLSLALLLAATVALPAADAGERPAADHAGEIDPALAARIAETPREFSRSTMFREHRFDIRAPQASPSPPAGADASFVAPHENAAAPPAHGETPRPFFLRSDTTLPKGWTATPTAVVHPESGLVCLNSLVIEDVGVRLDLVTVRTFDEAGLDAGCAYDGGDGRAVSLYASFWPDMTVEQHLEAALRAMNASTALLKQLPVAVATIDANPREPATVGMEPVVAGAFEIAVEGRGAGKTAIWLTKTYGWHVKARASYDAGDEMTEAVAAVLFSATHVSVRSKNMAKPTVARAGSEV